MSNASVAIGITFSFLLVAVLLGMVYKARQAQETPTDFYLAGRQVGTRQNALALFASFVLFSTLFTMVGHIALNGFDAFLFAAGFAVSFLFAMLLFAAQLRGIRGYTIGDLFAYRAEQGTARRASLLVTLLLYSFYTIVFLNAVGIVASVLFGVSSRFASSVIVGFVGLLVTLFVFVGGMRGITRLLAVKAVLVFGIVGVLTLVVLGKYRLDVLQLMRDAEANAPPGPGGYGLMEPGREFAETAGPALHLSKLFAVLVGHAALPYMFMRYFTTTTPQAARRSAGWAGVMFVPFYLCTAVLGLGAVAILGAKGIGVTPGGRDFTLPALADNLGGPWMVGLLGAVSFLIVAGVLAALLINAVTSATRDLRVLRKESLDTAEELQAARRNTLIIGVGSVVVGVLLLPINTHSLIPITVSLAGSVLLPAILYSLFWRRFNTAGLKWTVYGGMAFTLLAFLFSGLVSGTPVAFIPTVDFHFIDLDPALLGLPATFLLGYLGTVSSPERNDAGFAEVQVRAFTGAELATGQERRHATPDRALSRDDRLSKASGRSGR